MKERNAVKAGLIVFIALLWLLPATARAQDYVIAFADRPPGPMEIMLPATVKFAIKLQNKPEVEKIDLNRVKSHEQPRKEITAFNAPLGESNHPVRRN